MHAIIGATTKPYRVFSIRLTGSLDIFDVSAVADDSVGKLVETFLEVRKIDLTLSEDLTSQQPDDNFLRSSLDKGCDYLEYPALCPSRMVTDDAVIDFISTVGRLIMARAIWQFMSRI